MIEEAETLPLVDRVYLAMAANLSLVVLFIGYFVAYSSEIIGMIGTGGIVAAIILVIVAAVVGFLMGGMSTDTKKVLALGTGQRNLAAAFAVSTSNFATNPDVLVEIMVVSLTMYTYPSHYNYNPYYP